MSESQEPEIDKTEIEINIISELIGDNIILIIHQNGVSIMMDEEVENRSEEQLKYFSRLYVVATNPSFVLRFFLIIEVWLLLLWEKLEDFYTSIKKP